MSTEERLIDTGPGAVVRALAGSDDDDLNTDVLAQTCARKARAMAASREDALRWAEAAIACYRKASKERTAGYDRQGSELPLFGLRALMILRWGSEPGSPVLDPDDILRWIQEEVDRHSSASALREALRRAGRGDAEHERAVCLKERLHVGLPLFEKGLLPSALLPWFAEAGLFGEE